MGFVAYWPLKEVPELVYRTTFLGGHLDLGTDGTRIYSMLWLLAAIGFAAAGIALAVNWVWGLSVLLTVTLLSFVITALDLPLAYRGTIIDVVIIVVLFVHP